MKMNNNIINIQLDDFNVQVHVRENARAKRLSLKFHPMDGQIYLSKPIRAGQQDISKFLNQSREWIRKTINDQGASISFNAGNSIPILGELHLITYSYAEKPSVKWSKGSLHISGFDPIIVPGLVKDWLRTYIYHYINDTSHKFAKEIGKEIGNITIKDTKSRWGSCNRSGDLAYSWRLVLAPEAVAEYVCAHEVAHLIEMNHSVDFWKIVNRLCPNYVNLRKWLKLNGKTLFKYG